MAVIDSRTNPKAAAKSPRRSRKLRWRPEFVGYFYLVPAAAFFLTFVLFPLIQTFNLSMWDWTGIQGAPSTYVGLANYESVLTDPDTIAALSHSVVFIVTFC